MAFCLVGGHIITPFQILRSGVVAIEGNHIIEVSNENFKLKSNVCEIDVSGLYVSPGFIDIHVHGGGGYDVMDGSLAALEAIAQTHAKGGTTTWLATTLTAPLDQICNALETIQKAMETSVCGAKLLGAHLEGPYFHPEQAGAQNTAYLKHPDPAEYKELLDNFPCIKRVSAAPELPGGLELGRELRQRGILASIAHSNATYQQVIKAVEAGFSHVTHLYSGMSSVRRINAYRFAGVLEATLLLDSLTTEIIADGHHLPPSLMRLVLKTKGTERVCLVTDAMAAAGLGPGRYKLGGLDVVVEDDVPDEYEVRLEKGNYVAKLADRSAFAGSVATMNMLVRNMVHLVGLPLIEAVKMATWTPARILGIGHERGLLAPGMKADLVVFDEELNVEMTIVEGEIVYKKGDDAL
ncbi:MAG: N-acetylglucosamine-6-phosphate deacetylase [Methanomassiliicoccales archaeon]|nr:N-acetylglucosamine-6-phosphate deacetylase [Methanomassiliicoccales archaeon]